MNLDRPIPDFVSCFFGVSVVFLRVGVRGIQVIDISSREIVKWIRIVSSGLFLSE